MRGPVLYAVTWIALTCASAPVPAAPLPLEVYGRLPSLEDVALSPDGSLIAFVRTRQDTRFIAIISLADSKVLGAAAAQAGEAAPDRMGGWQPHHDRDICDRPADGLPGP